MWWKKDTPPSVSALTPGECECGHSRCCHKDGKGRCGVGYAPNSEDNETNHWLQCACQIFILDDDNDDDDESDPVNPEIDELEKIYKS